MGPTCYECGEEIGDWQANVMIPESDRRERRVSQIRVVCKPCTRALDESGQGKKWHSFCELRWLKDHPLVCLRSIIRHLVAALEGDTTWTWEKEAVEDVLSLAALAHPDLR